MGKDGGWSSSSAPEPISRNLTSTFQKYRRDRRMSRRASGLFGNDPLPGQRLLEGDSDARAADVSIEMTSLPPQWVDVADEARENLKTIKEKLAQLTKAQQKRLRKVFQDSGTPDKEVEAITLSVSQAIRKCESGIQQVKARGGAASSEKERKFLLNVQTNLAQQLQQLSQQFRQEQKQYMSDISRRQQGDLWDDTRSGGGGGFDQTGPDHGFSESQLAQLEDMEQTASQRSEEISSIAQSISDLHTIFKELAVLVIDQGSILDRIDYNIEQVVDQSRQANEQLRKAEKAAKSNRATKCMLLLAAVNVILLLILLIKSGVFSRKDS